MIDDSLFKVFLEDFREKTSGLKGLDITTNIDQYIEKIHALKSCCKMLQFTKLSSVFSILEDILQNQVKLKNRQDPKLFSIVKKTLDICESLKSKETSHEFQEELNRREGALLTCLKELESWNKKFSSQDEKLVELYQHEIAKLKSELVANLLRLEKDPGDQRSLQALKRIFHSIKGSAKLIQNETLGNLAHLIEEKLNEELDINLLLKTADMLEHITDLEIQELTLAFQHQGGNLQEQNQQHDKTIKLDAYHLDKIMGLAGEAIIDAEWLGPNIEKLTPIKASLNELINTIDQLSAANSFRHENHQLNPFIEKIHHIASSIRYTFSRNIDSIDEFSRRHISLIERFYGEVLKIRMRPFGDLTESIPRMVRDICKELGKEIKVIIQGEQTLVDRDILEMLESPLSHLVQNAIDHGIKTKGILTITAGHQKGLLHIQVSDNGGGIDLEKVRQKVGNSLLTDAECLKLLFQPGFSTKESISTISGRGFGLDVVNLFINQIGGTIKIETEKDKGTSFFLDLPITLSLIRTLIVYEDGEPYAFPLSKIEKATKIEQKDLQSINGQYFYLDTDKQMNIYVTSLSSLIGNAERPMKFPLQIIVMGKEDRQYGLLVEKFSDQKELVVKKIDERLGKIPHVVAGSTLDDGSPILILDIDEMITTLEGME